MKTVWVLTIVLGVVLAHGDIGYQYKLPQTSFGVPSYNLGESSSEYNSAFSSSGSGNYYKGYPSFSDAYNTGNQYSGLASSAISSDFENGFGSSLSSGYGSTISGSGLDNYYLNSGSSSISSGIGSIRPSIYHYSGSSDLGNYHSIGQSNQYMASALEKYKNYYQIHQQQPAQVFKHFYVHAAPEEPESVKPRAPIVLPPPQKHYKIIFVKTPSETRTPQVITVPQVQNEEKTIVYVLHKKSEDAQDIIIPKVEQRAPSKPEVYFIKYNTKEDSQNVINNIVKEHNQGQPVSLESTAVEDNGSYGNAELATVADLKANSALATSSVLSSTYGNSASNGVFDGSGLSSTSNNFALSNTYGISAPVATFDSSSLSNTYDNSGLSASYGTSDLASPSYASASTFGSSFGVTASPTTPTLADISFSTPVPLSSTPSTVAYDDASSISTSQGVPHETYGPPKFRVK